MNELSNAQSPKSDYGEIPRSSDSPGGAGFQPAKAKYHDARSEPTMHRDAVKQSMSEILKQPVGKLEDEAILRDLVTDSFVLIDMVIELQDDYDVLLVQDDLKAVKTVGDLVKLFEDKSPAGQDN